MSVEAISTPGPQSSGAPVELVGWLQELAASGGSDLHLKVNSPPMIREIGRLRRLDRPPVGGKDLSDLAKVITAFLGD